MTKKTQSPIFPVKAVAIMVPGDDDYVQHAVDANGRIYFWSKWRGHWVAFSTRSRTKWDDLVREAKGNVYSGKFTIHAEV